jgi:acetyl-CoA acyltransferase|tara:strand:- start:8646 stop:9824 length:1179 start_codon:yes stop_codon:yes gene_type:complete
MNEVYIIKGFRSAIGKSGKGIFRFSRPDDIASSVIKHLVNSVPQLEKERINDIIVGNATPEAEQGLNIGRMISLMSLDTHKVPGMTVNRYCSSGLETIALADAKIKNGMADCIIAGGVESMSPIPFGGWKIIPNYDISKKNPDWYWNMGLTAEAVAKKYKIDREMQDNFSYYSHQKALKAIKNGMFNNEIVPIETKSIFLDENEKRQEKIILADTDEGPRKDTTLEKLAKLRPVFAKDGSITAGNSSQTSDGAAFVILMSKKMMLELNLEPVAQLKSYSVAGVEPKYMGIGPVEAVPLVLNQAGLKMNDIEQIELNEAFASQSLAVINELNLNKEIVNVNGGAIALGHPLGCTGGKLTVQLIHEMKRRKQKYGMVTMCVGTGQGAAGIFEIF